LAHVRGRIDAGHVTSGGHGKAGSKLTDQAEADHHDLRPCTHISEPQAMQCDRGDRRKGGVLRGHTIGNDSA
jgi:hypothetical protein